VNALELRDRIITMCQQSSQTQVAKDLGVSLSYLSDVMHVRRYPGPKILKSMGLMLATLDTQGETL